MPIRSLRRLHRLLPHAAALALLAGAAAHFPCARLAAAQPETAPASTIDGGRNEIRSVEVVFLRRNPGLPDTHELLADATIEVAELTDGYAAPRLDERPDARIVTIALADLGRLERPFLYDSALTLVAPAVLTEMQRRGFIGIFVEPDPEQFTLVNDQIVDLRPPGDTSLRLFVTTGVVTSLRTVAMGDYLPESERINNPVHDRIRERSPVRPYSPGDAAERRDLLRRDQIDEHVFRLNRHPGRRVDVAVAPSGEEFGGVTLDYLVSENRPWFLYAQVANNGSEASGKWRERFGFVHNQLTRNDDVFSIDYLTASFDDVHSITASYEAPIGRSDRWRWRVFGAWSEYTASDIGLAGADFTGRSWHAGGQVIWNFWQRGDAFLDAFAGARWQSIESDDDFSDIEGDEDFIVPFVGVRFERSRASERTLASLTLEGYFLDGSDDELDNLGRFDADADAVALQWDFSHSFYLEPLFNPSLADAGSLAHEIYLAINGQYAFDHRLVPNFEQVAGGLYTVRGYPEAVAVGDTVLVATAEYRWHIPRGMSPDPIPGDFLGRPFRYVPQFQYGPTDWDLILRTFVDFGRTWNSDRLPFEDNQTLVGAGAGLELVLSRHLSARMDWGVALKKAEDGAGREVEAGDNEFHFVFTLVF